MGILDNLTSQVPGEGTPSGLVNEVLHLVSNQQTGGIQGLVQQFTGKGLGNIVNSWVGTGANLPITSQQIQQVLGSGTLQQLAAKMGISTDQVTSHLSKLLPTMIDRLTPNGQIPQGDALSKGLDLIRGMIK